MRSSASEWVIVGLTGVLVLATIWYALTTQRALRQGQEARRDGIGAFTGGSSMTTADGASFSYVITNLGQGVAYDLSVDALWRGRTFGPLESSYLAGAIPSKRWGSIIACSSSHARGTTSPERMPS